MVQEPKPDHACGRVCDYCTYNDIYIYFCIYCKKIITAKREPDIKISISLADEIGMKEYDNDVLEELK